MVINARIGHAMSNQLDRVNNNPARLQQEIARLEAVNEQQVATIRAQWERLELYQFGEPPEVITQRTLIVLLALILAKQPAGRLTITPAQAAANFGVSIATVNRALHSGRLAGWQRPNGHWLVDARASLLPAKGKGKKS